MNSTTATVYVGVDVAKATLQVHLPGRQLSLTNAAAGHQQLCQALQAVPGAHVICEATGGYEQAMVQSLQAAQTPVSVVNPAQVRAAALAQGTRAKTDRIDADLLTDYGQRYHPQPTPPVSALQRQFHELVRWLQQLIQDQAQAKTQAEHHAEAFVQKQHQKLMAYYEKLIEAAQAQIRALLEKDPELQARVQTLDAIQGVGWRTAVMVLAHLPELGQLNRQEVTALAGLAPWTRESGQFKGKCAIGGGRPEVRLALYMASLSASRTNAVLSAFYQHLLARGKAKKVALTAVMRKLLVYMNSQLKALATPPKPAAPAKT